MGYPKEEWKKWPVGDSTIDDDYISQGLEIFGNTLSEVRQFIESGKKANKWLDATNFAEQFLLNYANIPISYFKPYQQWQLKWATRQLLVVCYNDMVGVVKNFLSGKITKEVALASLDRVWEWQHQMWLVADGVTLWIVNGGTLADIYTAIGKNRSPVLTGDQWKAQVGTFKFDGKEIYKGVSIDDIFNELKDIYLSTQIPVSWPVVNFGGDVEIVRDDLTGEIITDDVTGIVVGEGSDIVAQVKKYALPVGAAVLALILLN